MPRILLVKTSSLGDVVHNLPVASDVAAALPGAEIDWVVEEAFAPLPAMHASVRRVVPAAVRRWRKSFWRSGTRGEVKAFVDALRMDPYDAVIDTQGLLKSALIARAARGPRYGLDWRASREPLAAFYDQTFSVPREPHAVERNRSLAAQALAYVPPDRVDYGIAAQTKSFGWLTGERYAVLLHGSSAPAKLWPEERWIAVGKTLVARGLAVVLPWGTDAERDRSARLAAGISGAIVPPRIDVSDAAHLLAGARCVIGLDTGLTHLAGALGIATVGIYTATHISSHGLYQCARAVSLGAPGAVPDPSEVEHALSALGV